MCSSKGSRVHQLLVVVVVVVEVAVAEVVVVVVHVVVIHHTLFGYACNAALSVAFAISNDICLCF